MQVNLILSPQELNAMQRAVEKELARVKDSEKAEIRTLRSVIRKLDAIE